MRNRSKLLSTVGLMCALALALAACGGSSSSEAQSAAPSGPAESASAEASASPSVDPMAVARLDGLYDVVKKVAANKGFTDIKVGETFKRTYDVMPDCETGPCGGTVEIDAEESKRNSTQDVVYDETTRTYAFKTATSPAICTGSDSKKYDLKTTSTFILTPTKVELVGSEYVVTKFTAVGLLKAVPQGAALSKGKCTLSTAKYTYVGHTA